MNIPVRNLPRSTPAASASARPIVGPGAAASTPSNPVGPAGAAEESALTFSCGGDRLCGILSLPPKNPHSAAATGVLIVVGGPQYRAGSHRQFVMLARHLAGRGLPCLRFDMRGMGDSSGALRDFEHAGDDIAAAITALRQAVPGVQRVVLWGLCDAASAALLYLDRTADPQVAGLALLNPWVRSEASLARTHVKHYYRERLLQRSFWTKLLRGGVALGALRGLVSNLRAAAGGAPPAAGNRGAAPELPYQHRMARAWQAFDGPVLLMLSGADLTAREFADATTSDTVWQAALRKRAPHRLTVAGADHTCSAPAAQRVVEVATADFLASIPAHPAGVSSAP